jgi:formylglycine-generating enzyme required for sulfatase activity
MGSPEGELGRSQSETQHEVTLTRDFELMTTEVTQGQFREVMGYNPSRFAACGVDCPVEQVTWYQAAMYANAVSEAEGVAPCYDCFDTSDGTFCRPIESFASVYDCPGYRLPTESEWEYAARAGDLRATYNGDLTAVDANDTTLLPIAWFRGNAGDTTHAIAGKTPNAWGLYDMLGNVSEWTSDNWDDYPPGPITDPVGGDPSSRVVRGGSWFGLPDDNRAANRTATYPEEQYSAVGFRLARSQR